MFLVIVTVSSTDWSSSSSSSAERLKSASGYADTRGLYTSWASIVGCGEVEMEWESRDD